MDVTIDSVNQSVDCDEQSLRTTNGRNSVNTEADITIDGNSAAIGNGSHLLNANENLKEIKRPRLETTQLFKDFLSNVKKDIDEKKQVDTALKPSSEEPKAGSRHIRYQKARKSTNPVQSSVFPFLLCFASKPKSGKHKSNGETVNIDDAKERHLDEEDDLMNSSKESISDEMLENNSIKIVTSENDNQESSDAILELTFDEPKKDVDAKESETTENSVQIKREIISDEMLENNSIKIVTENDIQGSSDAILELTFDEPKKNCGDKTELDEDLVKIKKEVINDEVLENNSIKIVNENVDQGSSDAILELTFDEPKKSSDEKTESREDSLEIKKETMNDEILEHNSIKIVTAEKDIEGSSDAILELTFDEPKKI